MDDRLHAVPYQRAPRPPMTAELARECDRAVHVITSGGSILRAGRACLYIIDQVGWHRVARLLARRPLIWAVEGGYAIVGRNRSVFSRLLFRDRRSD